MMNQLNVLAASFYLDGLDMFGGMPSVHLYEGGGEGSCYGCGDFPFRRLLAGCTAYAEPAGEGRP